MIGSIAIFAILYLLLVMEAAERSVLALLGAVVVVGVGLIPFEAAARAVDLNVIFLLVGMMTCVRILSETGFFEWVAMSIARKARGNALLILAWLLLAVIVFSAMLDNVTTIILLVPVTILIAEILELPPVPFIILEAIASNIGGTATLIGDPPNIIIGSRAGLNFNDFLVHLTPAVVVISLVFIGAALLIFRRVLRVPDLVRTRVLEAEPRRALRDIPKMKKSLAVFALMFCGFFLHAQLGVPPGVIALGGMALMLLLCRSESDRMFKAVEWDAVFFFIGLFIVIGALEYNGAIGKLAGLMQGLCGSNLLLATMVILWGSALFSSVLDNIPFVIAMTPMVQDMVRTAGGEPSGSHPLYWALALGACLGGNGTLIGASANVVASKLGQRNGYPITFATFLKYGVPSTLLSLLLATVYLWARYF